MTSIWLVATVALVPALLAPVVVALRGLANQRLAAVQFAGSITALMLAAITFATDQSSFIDIALCLALLSIAGGFLMALFMERWL